MSFKSIRHLQQGRHMADNKFTIPQESIAGAPTIEFEFDGSLCRAELAGAKLVADSIASDRANLNIVDAEGDLIADVMVRKMPRDENIAVSVMNIGIALLWSHARWIEAQTKLPDAGHTHAVVP